MPYVIHRVEDVTEFVRLKQQETEQTKLIEELRSRAEQRESEIYLRARELDDATRQLRRADEELAIAGDFTQLHGGALAVGDAPEGGALLRAEVPRQAPEGAHVVDTHRSGIRFADVYPATGSVAYAYWSDRMSRPRARLKLKPLTRPRFRGTAQRDAWGRR